MVLLPQAEKEQNAAFIVSARSRPSSALARHSPSVTSASSWCGRIPWTPSSPLHVTSKAVSFASSEETDFVLSVYSLLMNYRQYYRQTHKILLKSETTARHDNDRCFRASKSAGKHTFCIHTQHSTKNIIMFLKGLSDTATAAGAARIIHEGRMMLIKFALRPTPAPLRAPVNVHSAYIESWFSGHAPIDVF